MYHQPYSINCRKNHLNPYSPKEMCFENPSLYSVYQILTIFHVCTLVLSQILRDNHQGVHKSM